MVYRCSRSPGAAMTNELSSKMRSYMAEIFRLIDRQPDDVNFVTSSQLSDMLLVSPPAVNRMVNRLSDQGMLHAPALPRHHYH